MNITWPTIYMFSVLFFVAACGSPQSQCISSATSEQRSIERAIASTNLNISRGYAVHESRVPYTENNTCSRNDISNNYQVVSYPCPSTQYRTQETPVAIDINNERYKLAQLQAQYQRLRAATAQRVQACRTQFPAAQAGPTTGTSVQVAQEFVRGLNARVGQDSGGVRILSAEANGPAVVANIAVPTPAADMLEEERAEIGPIFADSLRGGLCGDESARAFFALGNSLTVRFQGSDAVPLTDVTLTSCDA